MKLAQEAEARKIKEAQEALARQQQAIEDQKRRDAEEAERIQAEQKRIEEAKESARLQAIEDQRLAVLKEQEEKDRLQKEFERQASLRPDKDKLLALANSVVTLQLPDLKSEEAKAILNDFKTMVNKIQAHIVTKVKAL